MYKIFLTIDMKPTYMCTAYLLAISSDDGLYVVPWSSQGHKF